MNKNNIAIVIFTILMLFTLCLLFGVFVYNNCEWETKPLTTLEKNGMTIYNSEQKISGVFCDREKFAFEEEKDLK